MPLTVLNCNYCDEVSVECWLRVISPGDLSQLRELHLRSTRADSSVARCLSQCPALELLDLGRCADISSESIVCAVTHLGRVRRPGRRVVCQWRCDCNGTAAPVPCLYICTK